jgi:peptide/nickel transport system ATP-binding protein
MAVEQAVKLVAKPPLLRAKALSKQYVQRQVFSRKRFVVDALNDVALEILPGCLTALVGASGSGKSTLASCLAMLERPDSGEVCFSHELAHSFTTAMLSCHRSWRSS